MNVTAAVITMSDKGSRGERADTSGPAVQEILKENGWEVVYTNIIPDDFETIKAELIKCADELDVCLVITTGGTGFSKRDGANASSSIFMICIKLGRSAIL